MSRAEGEWFDKTRHVQTSGWVTLAELGVTKTGYFDYLPSRASVTRQALGRLPLKNYADYTFVDLGSGKGRVLFVAAEFPFRKVQGVEFAADLHRAALQNIKTYRHAKRRCAALESMQADATEYVFPQGNLVVYLYNPFGAEALTTVLGNLQRSLTEQPRHVIVLLMNPECAFVIDAQPFLRLHLETPRYRIYQTVS